MDVPIGVPDPLGERGTVPLKPCREMPFMPVPVVDLREAQGAPCAVGVGQGHGYGAQLPFPVVVLQQPHELFRVRCADPVGEPGEEGGPVGEVLGVLPQLLREVEIKAGEEGDEQRAAGTL
ncbi:hypothetical protein ACH41H_46650 [Streptomyces sp. NPDC020800]|uniref:hypothetical protein n=1 Tax=Streptomyces sp. NPDC020800 TaxID=3365092 RepID=UPI00379D3B3E